MINISETNISQKKFLKSSFVGFDVRFGKRQRLNRKRHTSKSILQHDCGKEAKSGNKPVG